jgi:PilZ domain
MTMRVLWQILETPFTQLRLQQQLLAALVVLCCAVLTIYSLAFAAPRIRPCRLHKRRFVGRPVLISWRDAVGLMQSDDGVCQDLSDGGMALELPFPLKVRTRLNLRMPEAKLFTAGVVRRCSRVAPRYVGKNAYVVGVKFDCLTRALISS